MSKPETTEAGHVINRGIWRRDDASESQDILAQNVIAAAFSEVFEKGQTYGK